MDYYEKCQQNVLSSVDPDGGNGELIVTLPPQVLQTVAGEFGDLLTSLGRQHYFNNETLMTFRLLLAHMLKPE